MQKLQTYAGETLIETLAAVLLVTMTSVLFLSMTAVSVRISSDAREKDTRFQKTLSAAELQQNEVDSGSVSIGGRSYAVTYFADDDAESGGLLRSYAFRGDTP